jgi:hypothetical protein
MAGPAPRPLIGIRTGARDVVVEARRAPAPAASVPSTPTRVRALGARFGRAERNSLSTSSRALHAPFAALSRVQQSGTGQRGRPTSAGEGERPTRRPRRQGDRAAHTLLRHSEVRVSYGTVSGSSSAHRARRRKATERAEASVNVDWDTRIAHISAARQRAGDIK